MTKPNQFLSISSNPLSLGIYRKLAVNETVTMNSKIKPIESCRRSFVWFFVDTLRQSLNKRQRIARICFTFTILFLFIFFLSLNLIQILNFKLSESEVIFNAFFQMSMLLHGSSAYFHIISSGTKIIDLLRSLSNIYDQC